MKQGWQLRVEDASSGINQMVLGRWRIGGLGEGVLATLGCHDSVGGGGRDDVQPSDSANEEDPEEASNNVDPEEGSNSTDGEDAGNNVDSDDAANIRVWIECNAF